MGKLTLRAKNKDENGIALVLAIFFLLVLTLIGISSLNITIFDNLLAGRKRASEQAFYTAEAGIHEWMGRFREGSTHKISDEDPSNPVWKILLAKNGGEGAAKIGSVSGNSNSIQSLQTELDFGVEVKHKIDAANQVIQYAGSPLYLLKSYGFTSYGGNKIIEVELKKGPTYDPPGALYSAIPIKINGSSVYINGNDGCGSNNKPGIISTATITESGNPTINGSPPEVTPFSTPSAKDLPLQEMIDYLKADANFSYNHSADTTLTGVSDSWGNPVNNGFTVPNTYAGPMTIVYFNMQGNHKLKLTGGSHGAGILLVDGNLEVEGGFTWYGVIIVSGELKLTGGGDKNITGGILTGEAGNGEVDVGGNTGIIYCSSLRDKLKNIVPASKIARWREVF
jgi:hypothetical protein